jgi:solute carrier family 25 aspartate/glutamate transporter 12/13
MADSEFTQFIKGYQGERLRQAFHFFDQDGDGYINPDEFQKIIVVCCQHEALQVNADGT